MRRRRDKDRFKPLQNEYPGPDFASKKSFMRKLAKKYQVEYYYVYKTFWDIRERQKPK